MAEVLKFVFSSFWVWAGCFLMLCVIVSGIVGAIAALRGGA